jgi:hypothetical protein
MTKLKDLLNEAHADRIEIDTLTPTQQATIKDFQKQFNTNYEVEVWKQGPYKVAHIYVMNATSPIMFSKADLQFIGKSNIKWMQNHNKSIQIAL